MKTLVGATVTLCAIVVLIVAASTMDRSSELDANETVHIYIEEDQSSTGHIISECAREIDVVPNTQISVGVDNTLTIGSYSYKIYVESDALFIGWFLDNRLLTYTETNSTEGSYMHIYASFTVAIEVYISSEYAHSDITTVTAGIVGDPLITPVKIITPHTGELYRFKIPKNSTIQGDNMSDPTRSESVSFLISYTYNEITQPLVQAEASVVSGRYACIQFYSHSDLWMNIDMAPKVTLWHKMVLGDGLSRADVSPYDEVIKSYTGADGSEEYLITEEAHIFRTTKGSADFGVYLESYYEPQNQNRKVWYANESTRYLKEFLVNGVVITTSDNVLSEMLDLDNDDIITISAEYGGDYSVKIIFLNDVTDNLGKVWTPQSVNRLPDSVLIRGLELGETIDLRFNQNTDNGPFNLDFNGSHQAVAKYYHASFYGDGHLFLGNQGQVDTDPFYSSQYLYTVSSEHIYGQTEDDPMSPNQNTIYLIAYVVPAYQLTISGDDHGTAELIGSDGENEFISPVGTINVPRDSTYAISGNILEVDVYRIICKSNEGYGFYKWILSDSRSEIAAHGSIGEDMSLKGLSYTGESYTWASWGHGSINAYYDSQSTMRFDGTQITLPSGTHAVCALNGSTLSIAGAVYLVPSGGSGCMFSGWYVDGTKIEDGQILSAGSAVEAKFEPKKVTITLIWIASGEEDVIVLSTDVGSYFEISGTRFSYSSNMMELGDPEHTLEGWYLGGEMISNGETYRYDTLTEDVTITVRFTRNTDPAPEPDSSNDTSKSKIEDDEDEEWIESEKEHRDYEREVVVAVAAVATMMLMLLALLLIQKRR